MRRGLLSIRCLLGLGLLGGAALSGCSYIFDSEPPDFVVSRTPAPISFLVRLSGPERIQYVRGAGDSAWITHYALASASASTVDLRLLRLQPPFDEDPARFSGHTYVGDSAVYDVTPLSSPASGSRIAVHTPGAPSASDDVFTMPAGSEYFLAAPGDVGFLYYVLRQDHYLLTRRDGSFSRSPPISPLYFDAPAGDAGGIGGPGPSAVYYINGPLFDATGSTLVTRGRVCRLTRFHAPGACSPAAIAHSTTTSSDVVLPGVVDSDHLDFAPDQRALLSCGASGLVRIPLDGSPRTVLDAHEGCHPMLVHGSALAAWITDGIAYYNIVRGAGSTRTAESRALPLDGTSASRVLLADALNRRPLAVYAGVLLLYTRDAEGRWAGDASDGWIGDTRVMERGRAAAFSSDGTRLRFIEHAADYLGSGDLMSVRLTSSGSGGERLRLARNATAFHELPDGRVVVLDDQAWVGLQNRLLLVDEKTRTARILAEHVVAYFRIPNTTDLLLEILSQDLKQELWRLAIPPPD